MHRKHVLILGCSGFVGKRLLQLLLTMRNDYRITLLIHKNRIEDLPADVRVIRGSFTTFDFSSLENDFPDIIFHLARINSTRFGKWGRMFSALKGNIANRRLMNYLEFLNKEVSLIYLSGSLMYGNTRGKYAGEDTILKPVSFAREYIMAEQPFFNFFHHPKLHVAMVRVPWVLGNGSWFKSFYLDAIKKEKTIYSYSADNFRMMLIDADDCASSLIKIASLKHKGPLNLFMGQEILYKDFIAAISEASGIEQIKKYSSEELKNKFEPAIVEAFTEEILLDTKYNHYHLQNDFVYNDPVELVKKLLADGY
jgi:nucleoside-diphosphate-sugar epimerase